MSQSQSQADPRAVLDAHIRQTVLAQGWDINTPYNAALYLRDLHSLATTPPGPPVRMEHLVLPSGQRHIFEASGDTLPLRLYQRCLEVHGDLEGGGRALRAIALHNFWHRQRQQLDAHGLNWLRQATSDSEARRKLDWLQFILHYPVAPERQFHPEAIPDAALEEFLSRISG